MIRADRGSNSGNKCVRCNGQSLPLAPIKQSDSEMLKPLVRNEWHDGWQQQEPICMQSMAGIYCTADAQKNGQT